MAWIGARARLSTLKRSSRPVTHSRHLPADSTAIELFVKTALIARGHRPRRQLLNLLATIREINPVMLHERGEIADAMRSVVVNFAERKHRIQALLDCLLSVKPEHIVGDIGVVQQLLKN
jgi:hypothetical protein